MDLATTYLGLNLAHPLLPGASPLVDDMDQVRRLEDAGAAAIVLHSLFEEQILGEQARHLRDVEQPMESFPEALSYFPRAEAYRVPGPEAYLEQVQRIKQAVAVPVIASLNGVTPGGWTDCAGQIEQAGADALELNLYHVATDPGEAGAEVEDRCVAVTEAVTGSVTIPVAVKLSPFYSSLPNLVSRLGAAGARGVVLFNRFYQPDIDPETLETKPTLRLSDNSELLPRLRWVAILSGRVAPDLAVTGGVHSAADAIKAVMAGAHAVQLVSALLRQGPEHLRGLREELERWMESHDYESIAQMRGSMSLLRSPDPAAFERGNYVKILQGGQKFG